MTQMIGCHYFMKGHAMYSYINKKITTTLFILIVYFAIFLCDSFAIDYEGVNRVRYCKIKTEMGTFGDAEEYLKKVVQNGFSGRFNPAVNKEQANEYEFFIINRHCGAIVGGFAAVRAAMLAMASFCGDGAGSATIGLYPNLLRDLQLFVRSSKKAATNPACAKAYLSAFSSYSSVILGGIGIQYERARASYHNIRVCGSNWYHPGYDDGDFSKYLKYGDGAKKSSNLREANECKGKMVNDDKIGIACRQLFYDGVEVKDNPYGRESCKDNEGDPQKYYMKGVFAGNFNCSQYKEPKNRACCLERKREYICLEKIDCIEKRDEDELGKEDKCRKFCKVGENCYIGDAQIKIYPESDSMICAKTVNFCPFDFTIGGGSTNCIAAKKAVLNQEKWRNESRIEWTHQDLAEIKSQESVESAVESTDVKCEPTLTTEDEGCSPTVYAGKCINGCQYLRHCTVVDIGENEDMDKIASPYMPMACIDFKGDSKNTAEYSGIIIGNVRNFSAPIAQCFKETIENLFYNRAGRDKCSDYKIKPDPEDGCEQYALIDGRYEFIKGQRVREVSAYEFVQSKMRDIVKYALILSVTIYGFGILAGLRDIEKRSEILMFIAKIALISYFALGNAWQNVFFEAIYDAPISISHELMMFGDKDDVPRSSQGNEIDYYNEDTTCDFSDKQYEPGKKYLALWDTLDCKIMYYLGFGPTASVANIAILILAGFFTGPIGIYFSLSILFFAIFLILMVVRALYIFIGSSMIIIIMVFISPIIFSFLLFEKTKESFGKWLNSLVAYSIQPIFITIYLFIAISLMDGILTGSAVFHSDGRAICSSRCVYAESVSFKGQDQYDVCIKDGSSNNEIYYPLKDSVRCILKFDDFGTSPGFEAIALTFPILINILSNNPAAVAITLLKAALVMMILSSFVGQIPGIAAALTGTGSGLNIDTSSAKGVLSKITSSLKSVQKRANRMGKKGGKAAAKKLKQHRDKDVNNKSNSNSDSGADVTGNSQQTGGGNNPPESKA